MNYNRIIIQFKCLAYFIESAISKISDSNNLAVHAIHNTVSILQLERLSTCTLIRGREAESFSSEGERRNKKKNTSIYKFFNFFRRIQGHRMDTTSARITRINANQP